MTSKLITRIKNRPSYYFDKALKNDKIITVKYCLFTDNELEAKAIALKIKNEADNRRNSSNQEFYRFTVKIQDTQHSEKY